MALRRDKATWQHVVGVCSLTCTVLCVRVDDRTSHEHSAFPSQQRQAQQQQLSHYGEEVFPPQHYQTRNGGEARDGVLNEDLRRSIDDGFSDIVIGEQRRDGELTMEEVPYRERVISEEIHESFRPQAATHRGQDELRREQLDSPREEAWAYREGTQAHREFPTEENLEPLHAGPRTYELHGESWQGRQEFPQRNQREVAYRSDDDSPRAEVATYRGRPVLGYADAAVYPGQQEFSGGRQEFPQRNLREVAYRSDDDSPRVEVATYRGRPEFSQARRDIITQRNEELGYADAAVYPRQQEFSQGRHELPQRSQQAEAYQRRDETSQRQQDLQSDVGTFQGQRESLQREQELSTLRGQHEFSQGRQLETRYLGDDVFQQGQRDFAHEEVGTNQGWLEPSQLRDEVSTQGIRERLPSQARTYQFHESPQRRQDVSPQGNLGPLRSEMGTYQSSRELSRGEIESPLDAQGLYPQDLGRYQRHQEMARRQQEFQGRQEFSQGAQSPFRLDAGGYHGNREFSLGRGDYYAGRYHGNREFSLGRGDYHAGRYHGNREFSLGRDDYHAGRYHGNPEFSLGRGDYPWNGNGDYYEEYEYATRDHPAASLGDVEHQVDPRPVNLEDSHNEIVLSRRQPAPVVGEVTEPCGKLCIQAMVLSTPETSGKVQDDDQHRVVHSIDQQHTSQTSNRRP